MALCVYCQAAEAHPRDDYCSATCSRLAHGLPARERLTTAQQARTRWRKVGPEWWAELDRLKREINLVFGAMPTCPCGRRFEAGVSKKTGQPKRYCSEVCYHRQRHLERREERLEAMRARYVEHRDEILDRRRQERAA